MPRLHYIVPPIGIGDNKYQDGFTYQADKPARHCGICGDSFQPALARSLDYTTNRGIQYEVELMLRMWASEHNKKHTDKEKKQYHRSGRLLSPEAAIKLIPLGIYPIADLSFDEEVIQAGLEAKRAPFNDVPDKHLT